VNVASALSIAATAIAVLAGAMSRRLSIAPGWREQHRFSLVAFSAAGFALLGLPASLRLPDSVVLVTSRGQIAFTLLHLWSWFRYSEGFLQGPRHPAIPWLERASLLLVAVVLLPGVAFDGTFRDHTFAPFGVVYRDAQTTAFGNAAMAGTILGALLILGRLARAWASGVRHARVHFLALGTLIVFAVNDAVATSGAWSGPYLLDTGFVIPIIAVYWTLATRFVEEARTLERMRQKLSGDVAERTRDLARAEQALSQAERLAALGRFANGVAHEVNNPASVVTANLRWLADALESGDDRGDMAEVVGESLESMRRINDLVRKLVDAGRIASAAPGGRAALAASVERALDDGRVRTPTVEFTAAVPPDVWVRVHPESLSQVLAHLLANAAEAVPAGQHGHVTVRAERRPGTVRVTVADDGRGMSTDVLRRAFDPFFTTKPEGRGAGLGLAVSRGVVEGHGGSLWLESDEGRGTLAIFELPESVPPPQEHPL